MPGRSVTQRASCRALRCFLDAHRRAHRTLTSYRVPRRVMVGPVSADDTLSTDGKVGFYSGKSAKVQTDPPCGTLSLSCSRAMFQYSPPMPDSTVTYCRPWCV